jgi:hypothetical protein
MQINLKEKYTQILTIFKDQVKQVKQDELHKYFHSLYQMTHSIFTEIEKYYLYKDAVQDESTVCQELLMKMEKIHVTELVRYYANMTSQEEVILDKLICYERLRQKNDLRFNFKLEEISYLTTSTVLHSSERIINNIFTWCEMLIMLAEIYETKKRE